MHDYLSFSMTDGAFSLLNPLFFVYHAYIDYILELRIRMITSMDKAYESVNSFFEKKFTWRINQRRGARNEDVRTILKIFTDDGIMNNFGDYPLL